MHPESIPQAEELRMDADTLRLILIVTGALLLLGLYLWERWRARVKEEERREDERPGVESEPRLGAWDEADPNEIGASGPHPGGGRSYPGSYPGAQAAVTGTEQAFAASSSAPAAKSGHKPGTKPVPDNSAPGLGRGSAPGWARKGAALPGSDSDAAAPMDRSAPADAGAPLIVSLHITAKAGVFRGEDIVHAASKCRIEPGEMDIFHCYRDPAARSSPLFSVANMVKPGTFPFGAMAKFDSPGLTLFSTIEGVAEDPARLEEMFLTAHCLAGELDADIRDGSRGPLTPEAEERLRDRVLELVTLRLSKRARK